MNSIGFQCHTCGQYHDQLPMCFGSPAPCLWFTIPENEREARCLLSSDQCIIDEKYFFILGQLHITIIDSPEPFVWLVWVSLSESNFEKAGELWETEGRENEPPYFGWLQSELPTYETSTLGLKTSVHTMPVGERPIIKIEDIHHQLGHEQQHGISFSDLTNKIEKILHL